MHPTPHDAFFKYVFSQIDHAKSFLQRTLPAHIVAAIDWSTLKLEAGSFVDQALEGRHADLLLSATLRGRPILIYLLFEHQSSAEDLMALRLLGYMIRIWERFRDDNPSATRLPLILPIVLHHSDTGWNAPMAFEELLDLNEAERAAVRAYVPSFHFLLEDISHISDQELMVRSFTALVRMGLWCMKHSRSQDLAGEIVRWVEVLREVVTAPNGMAALAAIMHYICETQEGVGVDELRAIVAQFGSKEVEEQIMTLAERLRQEGREDGLKKGIEKGREEGIEAGLKAGRLSEARAALRRVLIRRKLHLGPKEIARIESCTDLAKLERWLDQAIDAPNAAKALR